MAKHRVLVVGVGKRGKHHATYFHANQAFEVAGLCDMDEARVKEAASASGTRPREPMPRPWPVT